MGKACAFMLGLVYAGHGLLGLVFVGHHILGVFNADLAIDLIFVVLGVILLGASRTPVPGAIVRGALLLSAAVMAVSGLVALSDDRLGGLAPEGISTLDVFVYFVGAAGGLFAAFSPRTARPIDA